MLYLILIFIVLFILTGVDKNNILKLRMFIKNTVILYTMMLLKKIIY